jgi:phage host-nuclease inhibitor protein Gam
MARTKKAAAAVPIPQDDVAAATQLRLVGEISRARADIRAAAETSIASIQEMLAADDAPLKAQEAELAAGLEIWAAAHRDRLTGGRTKTIRLTTGVLAWRARPPKVSVARGALQAVIAALAAAGLERFLRRKVELDKDAILKEPAAVAAVEGLSVASDGEEFVVEPFQMEGAS